MMGVNSRDPSHWMRDDAIHSQLCMSRAMSYGGGGGGGVVGWSLFFFFLSWPPRPDLGVVIGYM